MSASEDADDGQGATPGFLVQGLILLFDLTAGAPELVEIVLEPLVGNEQFDFVWTDPLGIHAVRVRSTMSMFLNSQVQALAEDLETANPAGDCQLQLVGMTHPRLEKVKEIGKVALHKRRYDMDALLDEAAAAVLGFSLKAGLPDKPRDTCRATAAVLSVRLGDYLSEQRVLSLKDLSELLKEGIRRAGS